MKNSLLLRFGTVITILFILAVSGMMSSMIITDTAEGYAAAINQAGTLRMQSYRIASELPDIDCHWIGHNWKPPSNYLANSMNALPISV